MSIVELGPIVKSIDVRRPAADAFHLFTDEIAAWWPTKSHSRARDADGEVTVGVTFEPRVGGRLFETLNTGEERDWGEVVAYEPGQRVVFTFQMGRPKEQAGEVEVRFDPLDARSCRVTLTHSHWERMDQERGRFDNGWEFVFVDGFGHYAETL